MGSLVRLRQLAAKRGKQKLELKNTTTALHAEVVANKGEYPSKTVAEAAGLADQTVRNLWWRKDA